MYIESIIQQKQIIRIGVIGSEPNNSQMLGYHQDTVAVKTTIKR